MKNHAFAKRVKSFIDLYESQHMVVITPQISQNLKITLDITCSRCEKHAKFKLN